MKRWYIVKMSNGKEESFTSKPMMFREIRRELAHSLHRDGKELYIYGKFYIMTKEAGMRNGFEWAFMEKVKA